MSRDQIHLEVLTPEQAVLAEDVDSVVLPAAEGDLGILPGHMPLMTSLDIGEMVVHEDGQEESYFIVKGFAEILTDRVRVMAEECEGVDEIDVEAARERLEEAEREVENLEAEATEEGEEELAEKYRESLKKERMRLMVSGEDEDE